TVLGTNICPGLYHWNGEKWVRMHEKCPNPCVDKTINESNSTQTVCSGSSISSVTYTSNSDMTVTGTLAGLTVTGNNTKSVTISGTPTASTILTISTRGTGDPVCFNDTKTVTVTVTDCTDPCDDKAINESNSTQTVCSGSSISSVTYTSNSDMTVTGTLAGLTITGNNTKSVTISGTPTASTILTISTRGTDPACANDTKTVTVTVNPSPSMTSPTSTSICSGSTFSYTPTSNVAGASFGWTRGTLPSGLTSSSSATSGTGSITDHVLTNSTTTAKTVNYTYTATANGCPSVAHIVTVTVNPVPTVDITPPATVCLNEDATFTASQNSGCTWSVSGSASDYTITGGTSGKTLIIKWKSEGEKTVTVTYTDANGCNASASTKVTVTNCTVPCESPSSVSPSTDSPSLRVFLNTEVELGPVSATFASGTPPATVSYQWYRSVNDGDYAPISGATNSSYTAKEPTEGTYKYYCEVGDVDCPGSSGKYTLVVTRCPGYVAVGGEYTLKDGSNVLNHSKTNVLWDAVKGYFNEPPRKDICIYYRPIGGEFGLSNWLDAVDECSNNSDQIDENHRGLGWRLPTVGELAALQSVHSTLQSQPTSTDIPRTEYMYNFSYWSSNIYYYSYGGNPAAWTWSYWQSQWPVGRATITPDARHMVRCVFTMD
ncbi:hypothetical protein M2132_002486, partial [Dysgonomonas sp. PH5-45]|uniref:PKD-like domain-containing protein n=1 Tax=unclassified Dysgonomonas TaxID=2630389 RepID=UPI002474C3FB